MVKIEFSKPAIVDTSWLGHRITTNLRYIRRSPEQRAGFTAIIPTYDDVGYEWHVEVWCEGNVTGMGTPVSGWGGERVPAFPIIAIDKMEWGWGAVPKDYPRDEWEFVTTVLGYLYPSNDDWEIGVKPKKRRCPKCGKRRELIYLGKDVPSICEECYDRAVDEDIDRQIYEDQTRWLERRWGET
jgi:hypothetical protein